MNNQKEKISVIVPIYNVEKYLRNCVDSILNQTYPNLEIILVDDGSPDECGIICDEYSRKDSRIKVIHKENGGLSDARNAGLNIATGEYVQFVDSDDSIHPRMSEILLHTISETESDLAICNFIEIPEVQRTDFAKIDSDEIVVIEKKHVMEQLEKRNLITVVAWNKLYKKKLWNELRYPKGRVHEDEFVIHRILHQCEKIAYVSAGLYFYVQRENSITGKLKLKNVEDSWAAYKDRVQFLSENQYLSCATDAKKDMLHLVVKYYDRLEKMKGSSNLRRELRKQFQEIFESNELKTRLDTALVKKYELFCEKPKKYYTVCKNEMRKKKLKDFIGKIIKR